MIKERKMFFKSTACALSLAMTLSVLVGCGGDKAPAGDTQSVQSQSGQSQTAQDTNTGKGDELYKFKIFFPGGTPFDEEAEKPWYDYVSKVNNVEIELEIPPASSASERLQIVLAGGDFPDVIRIADLKAVTAKNAVENGTFVPVTQYIKDAPNLQKYTYDMSWDALKLKEGSDDILGIPVTTVMRYDGMAVRQDWLDNVGIKLPEDGILTLDQFTEIMRKFTKNDPNKNGKDDTYGYSDTPTADGSLMPILTAPFGLLGWQEYGGKYKYIDLKYSREHDNYKKALEYSAMLYKEGLVDPNTPVNKGPQLEERFLQGIFGTKIHFAGRLPLLETELKKISPDAKVAYINGVKGENGEVKGPGYGTGLFGMWAVTKSAKQPERIVKFFDSLLSDELWQVNYMGLENVHYKKENDKLVATDLKDRLKNYQLVRRKESIDLWVNPVVSPADWLPLQKKWIEKAIEIAVPSKDMGYFPPVSTKPEFIDANKNLGVVITKIIIGSSPVSEYDKALDAWYKAGGEEYIVQMNEYIEKLQSKK